MKLKKTNPNSSASNINYDNLKDVLKNALISEQASRALNFLRDSSSASARFAADGDAFTKTTENSLPPNIRSYIDHKFQILTDYLIMREKSFHDKLDRVIELIKSKN